jgi:hypothetical protein
MVPPRCSGKNKNNQFGGFKKPLHCSGVKAKSQSGGKEKCGCTAGAQPLKMKDGEGLPYRESCR